MKLNEKILNFSKSQEDAFFVFDTSIIEENYHLLKDNINHSKIYYAVKANSHERIIKTLVSLNSCFDVASIGELDLVLKLGASAENISYGNTIKKEKHIKYAYDKGVRLFVADEFAEVEKISRVAPNSKLFIRIEMSDSDSDWPLTKKFGTNIEKAKDLLRYAKKLNLIPYGISFHVGSQCYDKYMWKKALLEVFDIFETLKHEEIFLSFINTGGGMPVQHLREIPEIKDICDIINETINEYFSDYPNLVVAVEPGRSMVGNSAILCSNVVLVSQKEKNDWVYIDTGIFHSLMEAIEGFQYEVVCPFNKGKDKIYTLSGPTCDSVDTLYDEIYLPDDIKINDKIFFINAGAYTTGYASKFNGILPPKIFFIDEI
jgi:ornithine decarboxylase